MGKAIIFSDVHLHIWGNFNVDLMRTRFSFEFIEDMFVKAHAQKVPLLFPGDLFHDPESISNTLWSLFQPFITDLFNRYPSVHIYAISGNHDMRETNSYLRRSPSYINTLSNTFKNFHCIDFSSVDLGSFALHGIPYITHNEGFMDAVRKIKKISGKPNILMLHTDFKNQKDTNGIIIGKGTNVEEDVLASFDLVLSGHVHKPGHLRSNIYSIGAPCQQRSSDMDGKFGYWNLKDDFSLNFKPINGPRFKTYKDASEIVSEPLVFWIKENVSSEDIDTGIEFTNVSDKFAVVRDYLSFIHNSSKLKHRYLNHLLNKLDETD